MSYFPPYSYSKNKIEVKLDLSNYAIKFDLKNAKGVDTSQFDKKDDLVNLKSEIDKLNIDKLSQLDDNKLKHVSVDLKKLIDLVHKTVAKKDLYDAKIRGTTNLGTKAALDAKIYEVKYEISSVTNLAATSAVNAKINEIKSKILSITNLVSTAALTTVENKILNVSDLVKKSNYDAEIKDIKGKYCTTYDYSKFMKNKLDAKITEKKLVNDLDLNEKIKKLAVKE